jgi:hypothetical protein
MIDMAKLARVRMCAGNGDVDYGELCMMEMVDYVTSGGTSDHPECASPVIAAFLRRWNDMLQDSDRDRLLRPLISHVVGTRTTQADELTRSFLSLDWLVRTHLVAWLRLSPSLVAHAEAVAALPAITTIRSAKNARAVVAAAGDAAWAAAGAEARAAAGAEAGDAARDAAWAAAQAAAGAAAGAAARAARAPTASALQVSAQHLVLDMCAVGRAS